MVEHPGADMRFILPQLGVLLLIGLLAPMGRAESGASAGGGGRPDEKGRLADAVVELRLQAVMDPAGVLPKATTPEGLRAFQALEKGLFTVSVPATGWSAFFATSIYTMAPLGEGRHAVLFYHPWSDIALLTYWKVEPDRCLMERVSLLLGDAIRQKGKAPFELAPYWERESPEITPILALPLAAGATLRAFEAMYPAAGAPARGSAAAADRQALEACMDEEVTRKAMLGAANLRFEKSVAALVRYLQHPDFQNYREYMDLILADLRKGELDRIEPTVPETNQEIFQLVKKQARVIGRQYRVAGVLKTRMDCFVFLNHPADPNQVLVFWLQTDGKKYGLRQVGLIQYQLAVAGFEQIQELVQQARQPRK